MSEENKTKKAAEDYSSYLGKKIDTLPYNTFRKLKERYPTVMVLINDQTYRTPGLYQAFKTHRDLLAHLFKQKGVEILRFKHNYASLSTRNPELGVVFVANDSVVNPGLEAWVLIGHNARYINDNQGPVKAP